MQEVSSRLTINKLKMGQCERSTDVYDKNFCTMTNDTESSHVNCSNLLELRVRTNPDLSDVQCMGLEVQPKQLNRLFE